MVKFFNEAGWGCIRIAGSGSSRYPAPDILAGNAVRRIAVECKVIGKQKKYLAEDDVAQLRTFSTKFGAESWMGIHFPGEPWYFLMLEDLEKTESGWAISIETAKRRGLTFPELLQDSTKNQNI